VRAQGENISRAGDGDSVRVGRERPPLDGVVRSPRTIWSISSRVKPEISIGASARISSSNSNLQLVEVPLALLA
jgi:hypothetical protein